MPKQAMQDYPFPNAIGTLNQRAVGPSWRFIKLDPACDEAAEWMEFRLTYEGRLLGASRTNSRAAHKHEIRRIFHRQLAHLFKLHPAFVGVQPTSQEELDQLGKSGAASLMFTRAHQDQRYRNRLKEFERGAYQFFPLVTRSLSLLCSVQVLFLRPDLPGGIISSGDIDNRMKTIFDALRIAHGVSELGGFETPAEDERPFFCLLEDDSLINHAAIETDTLLQPIGNEWDANDARLIITVRLSPYGANLQSLAFV